mmetsp:Transcript_6369/g.12168  ORF Transcript_6369/g.12168 Transcript_6369/m.12168 type:complete len:317 (-) Transcript_6369:59-1009(-)
MFNNLSLDKLRNAAEDAINAAKPKSDHEALVFECLSHKNWGASSTIMNNIARDTYDYDKYPSIAKLLWEGLDGRPAAWRVVFKALTLLEHLIKNGSERVIDDARNRDHKLRSLYNFNYYEGSVDRGSGVREKSKQIVELLQDNERIREERERAKELRDKFAGQGGGGGDRYGGYGNSGGRGGGGGGFGGNGYSDSYSNSAGGYGNSGIGSDYSRTQGGGNGSRGRYSDTPPAASGPSLSTNVGGGKKKGDDLFNVVKSAANKEKISISLPGGKRSSAPSKAVPSSSPPPPPSATASSTSPRLPPPPQPTCAAGSTS